jgi:acyl-CoA thioesterase FadM
VAEGVAWLVRAVALDVRQPALHGERLSVTTRVVGYRRIWARRRTVVSREGALVADVVTDWILLGSDGRPLRIPVEVVERLPGEDGPIEPIRVGIGPAPPSAIVVDDVIRPAELDPMGHVNNAAYLDRLMTLAGRVQPPPASAVLDRPSIRIEYAAAAGPDQPVRELAWPLEEGRGVAYRITALDGSEIVRAILAGPVL